jgi:hypothetical protein
MANAWAPPSVPDAVALEPAAARLPLRTIHRGEALEWLARNPARDDASVITSLPDFSELRELEFSAWQGFFVRAARAVLEWVSPAGAAIFFQTDVRRQGVWVEKSELVLGAARAAGSALLWHKIVCREPPGSRTYGRAGYSHLLCFSKDPVEKPVASGPDVLADGGFKPTEKAMGVAACRLACQFVLDATTTRVVVDPFCGHGTALAVANAMGLDAVGVERNARCCRAARRLSVSLD